MPGWGDHAFGWVFMLVFWVLAAVGIFLLIIRRFASPFGSGGLADHPENPLENLKRRYENRGDRQGQVRGEKEGTHQNRRGAGLVREEVSGRNDEQTKPG